MDILYNDRDITVCIKEPSLLSEKSTNGADVLTKLEKHLSENGESSAVFPLHRLDFGVGGTMAFAKNKLAAAKMSELIAARKMDKEYLAVLIGVPKEINGTFDDLLFKDSHKNKSFVVDRERAGVKRALLEYTLIKTAEHNDVTLSLVKIRLHTGRSHQIRVQFSHRKLPLYGDRKYGAKSGKEIALWSYKLSFIHPKTGKELKFSSLPEGEIWKIFDISSLM